MLNGPSSPSLYLDYGADAQACDLGDVDISERGMRFTSRWQFSIGTQISVLLVQMDPRRGLCRMAIDGLVVWCEPKAGKGYESTLLFLELPDELKPSLREFSHQLTAG
jgi:hypothetical protein